MSILPSLNLLGPESSADLRWQWTTQYTYGNETSIWTNSLRHSICQVSKVR